MIYVYGYPITAVAIILVAAIISHITTVRDRDAADIERIEGMFATAPGNTLDRTEHADRIELAYVRANPTPQQAGEYQPRHAAVGEVTQEIRIQFAALISDQFGTPKCDSCAVGRDGEHQHQSCVGCSCPCGDSQGAQIMHVGEAGRNAWMGEVAA
jgi:hypothetical protein